MKNISITLLFVIISIFIFSSCNNNNSSKPDSTESNNSDISSTENSSTTPSNSEDDIFTHYERTQELNDFEKEIILQLGADYGYNDPSKIEILPLTLHGRDFNSPEELPVWLFYQWYVSRIYVEDLTQEEKEAKYNHPPEYTEYSGGWFIPEEHFIPLVQQYFDVSEEYLKSDKEVYQEEYKGFHIVDFAPGIGDLPEIQVINITGDPQNRLLIFHLGYLPESSDKYSEEYVVTVKIEDDNSFKYISNYAVTKAIEPDPVISENK